MIEIIKGSSISDFILSEDFNDIINDNTYYAVNYYIDGFNGTKYVKSIKPASKLMKNIHKIVSKYNDTYDLDEFEAWIKNNYEIRKL